MKWAMDIENVEAVQEKIWDLHDKFSDVIHSISRTHFTKSLKNPDAFRNSRNNGNGFVFVKDNFDKESAILEAKSLNSIRCALENLEDQLESFHTVQIQQRAERDAALARLEQSRVILALRLAEHHGKRYTVIDEAMEFVGDVRGASCFVSPELVSSPHKRAQQMTGNASHPRTPNFLVRVLLSAKRTLQLDKMSGVLGNAALFALSMLALLHIHQVTCKDNDVLEMMSSKHERTDKNPTGQTVQMDVQMGRG